MSFDISVLEGDRVFADSGEGAGDDISLEWSTAVGGTVTADAFGDADEFEDTSAFELFYAYSDPLPPPAPGEQMRWTIDVQKKASNAGFPVFHFEWSGPTAQSAVMLDPVIGVTHIPQPTGVVDVSLVSLDANFWRMSIRVRDPETLATGKPSESLVLRIYPAYTSTWKGSPSNFPTDAIVVKGSTIERSTTPRRVRLRRVMGREGLRTDSRTQAGVRGRAIMEPGYARANEASLLLEDAAPLLLENGIALLLEDSE